MNIGYHSNFMDRIIERADKRSERKEKMINKMLDKSEAILQAGKPHEMTNEEWLDRKSTKEKAEWLFKLTYKCYWCGREYTPRSLSLYNEKECPFKKCMKDKKDFEKWLKEKHDDLS